MEASLLAVTERERRQQPQATETEGELEKVGVQPAPCQSPLTLYWLPLKHLQLDWAGEALGLHSPLSTFRIP